MRIKRKRKCRGMDPGLAATTWILQFQYVVISVCLFVYPIITQEPLDWFALNFDYGTRESQGNEILSWVGRLLAGKIAKIVIYDQVRVTCRSTVTLTLLGSQTSIYIYTHQENWQKNWKKHEVRQDNIQNQIKPFPSAIIQIPSI